ncbi:MAG: hypothetical protein WC108_02305 [Bacteroidales bacterium]
MGILFPLPFEQALMQDPLMFAIFFTATFFLMGASVKFIDDAFDEKAHSRKIALILSPLTAILWAVVMALHPAAALLLTAITLGVLIKGKIDNIAFVMAVLCIYVIYFFIGDWKFILEPMYLMPLIIITVGGVLDEVGNDFVDKNQLYKKGFFGKLVHWFFEYRFVMKIIVFVFALIGTYPMFFFFAFFLWDLGYELVMHYSKHVLRKRKFYYDKKASSY